MTSTHDQTTGPPAAVPTTINSAAPPSDLDYARTTPVFTTGNVPAGLLREHRLAAGVWGRLVVQSGTVKLVYDEPATSEHIHAGNAVHIPPERSHHVELDASARFVIEIYRTSSSVPQAHPRDRRDSIP